MSFGSLFALRLSSFCSSVMWKIRRSKFDDADLLLDCNNFAATPRARHVAVVLFLSLSYFHFLLWSVYQFITRFYGIFMWTDRWVCVFLLTFWFKKHDLMGSDLRLALLFSDNWDTKHKTLNTYFWYHKKKSVYWVIRFISFNYFIFIKMLAILDMIY